MADVRGAGGEVLIELPEEISGVDLFTYERDTDDDELGLVQPAPRRA